MINFNIRGFAIHKLILFAVILASLSACQPSSRESELTGSIQGTTYHIKMVMDGLPIKIEEIKSAIEQTFADIDIKLSNYRDDSEISRLNREQSSDWLPVSREIATLTAVAKQVSEKTRGCYDLTVKPLFDLWGFSKSENRIPTDEEIDRVLAHVGMARVDVDTEKLLLRRQDPAIQIDMSSIAQGYTVAAVAKLLENRGIHNYLAEIGGEMRVKGTKADGEPWRIAIEKPTPFTREIQRIIEIHQKNGTAVMTSGTYRNFFEENGRVYSHIIDPRTGRPVTHQLLSVTVLGDDPVWADAWGTALLCVGEKEAIEIAEKERLKALLIYREGGEFKEAMSSAFQTDSR
ncbi:MAG: FAD:protein FMN transferase [Gammaproteobacteria bacterium]